MGLHGIKVFIGYFHWLSWEKLPVHKNYGGMGFKDLAVGTKGVSQYHLLNFDNNKVLKISIGYAKQFVQVYKIHNQSTIHKDSD